MADVTKNQDEKSDVRHAAEKGKNTSNNSDNNAGSGPSKSGGSGNTQSQSGDPGRTPGAAEGERGSGTNQ